MSNSIENNEQTSVATEEIKVSEKKPAVKKPAAKKSSTDKKASDAAKKAAEEMTKAAAKKNADEKKKAAEDKKKADAAAKRAAEEKKKADESAKRAAAKKAADEKKKAEAEARRAAEEKKKADEAAKRAAKKAADDKKKAEAKKAADDKKKVADEKKKASVKKPTATKSAEKPKAATQATQGAKETDKEQPKTESKAQTEKKTDVKKSVAKKPDSKNNAKSETKSSAETKNNAGTKAGKKPNKLKYLGGLLFAKMLKGGASELHSKAEEVNKLNVFPVPDGDTGDNMTMTIESGVASLNNIETDDLAEVLKVASRGMLLGARGNSGVILSQFFAGMAKGVENVENASSKEIARALELGVEQAYSSVMTPTEGTILTVAREAVEYAVSRLNSKSTVQSLFSDLVKEMNASLERTPELLPTLSEAGVVDSGGAGLLYIIDGLNRVLNGEEIEETDSLIVMPKSAGAEIATSFGPDSDMEYGYCTELLVQLMNKKTDINNFDIDALKIFLATIGDSIVAFQTESIVKIHVHTLTPEKVLKHMRKFGEFLTVKIENMSVQHTDLRSPEDKKPPVAVGEPKKKFGVVAVSNGAGISELFRQLGTDEIVEGGQTNNPSTSDFIEAFGKINAENIFVFPNNGNIIMAAGQAAEIYEEAKVYVIPSKSIGAGYVALSSMNFESGTPDSLIAEADEAIGRIVSAAISPAIRDADMNGVHVNEGDTIGIVAKEIVVSDPTREGAAHALVDHLLKDGERFMLTVFTGKDATAEEAAELESYIRKTYKWTEVYFIEGGQEVYPYLFVAE